MVSNLEKGNLEYETKSELCNNEDYNNLVKYLETITQKCERQEGFLLNISHDLRAHLNVILSVIQCIQLEEQKGSENKKLKEYMGIAKRNSFKMLKLINNLIDTTKFQNNYYTLEKKNIDIISMVEGTITCIDRYAKEKDIQLIFDTNEEECIMAVDPEVLDRIIMNLVSNAIKFSPANTNIYINMFINESSVKLSVRDEGPGIDKDEQDKIFNRFYQIGKTNKSEHVGSGIGLDLVNYLTKALGGTIVLNTNLEKGTEFIVELPINSIEEQPITNARIEKEKIEMLEIEFSDIYL